MLSKVEVRNRRGDTLELPFDDNGNGLAINEIEGLDPTKATLVSSGFAGKDGEQYYYSKRDSRNLKIKLDIIPDFVDTSAKSLRAKLYQFLMPKTEVTLRFYDDLGSYLDVVGRVEDFISPVFAKDPYAEISLMCFDPDFFDPNPVTVTGTTITGTDVTMTTVRYQGSVEAGFIFTLNLDRALSSFTITLQVPDGSVYTLLFAETLLAGDKLVISTVSGSRGASLTRNNVISSILWGVSPQAKWLEFEGPGDNWVRVSASAAGVPWTIQYVNRHGGL